jgi:hypothetical protein
MYGGLLNYEGGFKAFGRMSVSFRVWVAGVLSHISGATCQITECVSYEIFVSCFPSYQCFTFIISRKT